MKKTLCLLVMFLMLITGSVYADFAQTSGQQSADSAICASHCYITGIQIETDGSNNVTLLLYDNASAASGKVVADITVVAGDYYGGRVWVHPIECFNGCYADVTGTNGTYFVEFIHK